MKTLYFIFLSFFIFCAFNLSAQIKFTFIDKLTKEKVAEVQLVTRNNRIYFSDTNGEIKIEDNQFLPVKINRVGYLSVQLDSINKKEIVLELTSNFITPQVEVFAQKENILKNIYGDKSSVDKNISGLNEKGVSETKEILKSFSMLQVKDYGGNSGFQTFSARGTTSSQNIVVVDGMIVNDMTSGVVNLSFLSMSAFKKIAVQTGGFSADVASGGFGSTVYFESGNLSENKTKLSYTTGSFGKNKIEAEVARTDENKSWFLLSDIQKINGNFSYELIKSGKSENIKRKNNESQSASLSAGYSNTIDEWKVSSVLFSTVQKQGIPGPVFIDNEFNSNSELDLTEFKNITSLSKLVGENIIRFSTLVKFQQYDFTENKTDQTSNKKDYYNEKEYSVRGDYLGNSNYFNLNSGFYFRCNLFNSNQLNSSVDKNLTERISIAFFSIISNEIANGFLNKLSGRFETANHLPSVLSGSYSLNYTYKKCINSLTFSRMVRYPSFTELHFVSLGFPELTPEKYWGIDFATKYQTESFSNQIKLFAYLVHDKIISIPKNPIQWTTLNSDEVRGFGIEQNMEGNFNDFSFDESVSLQSVKNYKTVSAQTEGKYLIYNPAISSGLSTVYTISDFKPFVSIYYSGEQYYSPENLENEKINGYWILNSGFNYSQIINQIKLNFQFQIKNILDQNYEYVKSYPQPGRSFELKCEASF